MKRNKLANAQPTNGKRVIIYLRVSTDDQKNHGYGLDAQKEACTQYAVLKGYEVVDILSDEGLSGKLPMNERPSLMKAFTMCLTGQADGILCYAQDRLARDMSVWTSVRDAAMKASIRLETVKEGTDFTTKESQFMGDIHAAVAAQERRTIAERLYNGRRQRSIDDGLGSGRIPWGYTQKVQGTGKAQTVTIEIDKEAAKTINFILNEREKGTTYDVIAKRLRDNQDPMRNGSWNWTRGSVETIMRHERLYKTGIREWDDVKANDTWPILWKQSVETV